MVHDVRALLPCAWLHGRLECMANNGIDYRTAIAWFIFLPWF